jgi:hypothetical protein
MTLPAFLFGFFVATLLGAVFHLWKDGGAGRLLLYLILSWVGFITGQVLSGVTGISFFEVGPLHLGMAILSSGIFLGVGHWLSLIQVERTRT